MQSTGPKLVFNCQTKATDFFKLKYVLDVVFATVFHDSEIAIRDIAIFSFDSQKKLISSLCISLFLKLTTKDH
jgi:hypothetical protein